MKITDEYRERYDIPHVDEIQQALEEATDDAIEKAWFESEAEFDKRDEVYPDDIS